MGKADVDKEPQSNKASARDDADSEGRDIIIHADYELFVATLLVLQIVNSVLLIAGLPTEQRHIVFGFWIGISLFLLVDLLVRYRRASKQGRAILTNFRLSLTLGSLPVPFATSIRLLATALLLRRLKRGQLREIGHVVVSRHAQSTILFVALAAVLVFEFGSISILTAEAAAADANIVTSQDAIWWSLVTISTVGYGDTYPITYWGRMIGYILIITGVGLFTTTTSYLARWFIRPSDTSSKPLNAQAQGPHEQIREIQSLLSAMEANQESAYGEIKDRLAQLENLVDEQRE